MALTQVTSIGIKNGEIVNADLHSAAAIVLSKLNTTGTASSSTFLRGDGAWTAMSADGGNAATLDSIDSSQFLRSDASDTATGQITFDGGSGVTAGPIITSSNTAGPKLSINSTASGGKHWMIISNGSGNTDGAGYLQLWNSTDSFSPVTFGATSGTATEFRTGIEINNNTVWNAGNDGSGSGLDADTLDGMEPAGLFSTGHTQTAQLQLRGHTNSWAGGIKFISNDGNNTAQLHMDNSTNYDLMVDSSFYVGGDIKIAGLSNIAWHAGNDGSGSGLDADTLDGQEGSYYRNASNLNAGTYPDLFSPSTRYNIGLTDGYGGDSYDKWRVWNDSSYAIGMHSGMTHGWLNDYAMTFTMNNESDRGFVWRDTSDGQNEAAMSLSTDGNLNVGNAIGIAGNTSNYWMNGSWGFRHKTPHGYIEFGPANTGHAHIYTDRSNFYFNKTVIYANGNTMFHAGNDGSGSGLDADTLDGLQLGTGRNNSANQVVRTNSSGYIDTGYINTSCDDTGTGVDCKFYASQDDYIRYIDKASMRSVVNSPARSTAYEGRESYTSDTNYWMGTMGDGADNFDSTVWDYGSGAFDVWSNPSGQPSGTSHWCGLQSMHYTNGSARYGMRLMLGAGQTALAYIQGRWNTTTYGWHKLWNEGNDGAGSGLDADTVDGIEGANFLRSDTGDTASGDIIFTGGAAAVTIGGNSDLRFNTGSWTGESCKIQHHSNWLYIQGGSNGHVFRRSNASDAWYIGSGGTLYPAGNGSYGIGTSSNRISTLYMGGVLDSTTTIRTDDWFYNDTQGEGMYSSANGMHWYSDHTQMMNAAGGTSANGIRFRDESGGTIRGYVYSTTSNIVGFLDYEGSWSFSTGKFTNYSHRDLCSQPDDGHDLGYGNRRWDNVYATNGTIQTSDRNEKENIVATDLGLAFVNKLSPVSFKRKGKTRTHYGFIAQDIEQIITDLGKTTTQFAPLIKSDISEAQDGSEYRYGLRYEQLLAPVVKAIQELAVKVAALESA